MASQLSPYADQALLNSLFGQTSNFGALGSPPTFYLGLSSTTPAVSGDSVTNITEPSGGAYARVATSSGDWNAATEASPAVVTNASLLSFPQATDDWALGVNMTYAVLFDAATDGNCLGFTELSDAKPVTNTDTPTFPTGAISFNLT